MNSLSQIFRLSICGFISVLLLYGNLAFSQDKDTLTLSDRAILLAQDLKVADSQSTQKHSYNDVETMGLLELRQAILNTFDQSYDYKLSILLEQFRTKARFENSESDLRLATMYNALEPYASVFLDGNAKNYQPVLDILSEYFNDEIWVVSHQSHVLAAALMGGKRNFTKSLTFATEAQSKLPNDNSPEAEYAKFHIYTVIAYLHGVLKNPQMATQTLEEVVDLSRKTGLDVQASTQLNNLIYAFSGVRDHETAAALITILLSMENSENTGAPGLTDLRAAQTYINLDDYDTALTFASQGLAKADNPLALRNLKIAQMQAIAGMGDGAAARALMAQFNIEHPPSDPPSEFITREMIRTNALIAGADGDARTAIELMEDYNDMSLRRVLAASSTDTSNMLANLENDKVRQQERAQLAAAREEALRSRIRASNALLIVAGIVLLFAGTTAVFANYRRKTAVKLADAAEAALSGEKAKSQFLAVISHELRTPLNGIIGIADLLSRTAPTPELRHKIGIINNSGHDLLSLVEQVLDMSRIDAQEMEVFPEYTALRPVIESLDTLWRPTIEKKSVTFTSYIDPNVPETIKIDPMRLRQCINNLISNASKFTSQGRVHMHVTAAPILGTHQSELTVIVADTGIGMSETVQNNLFKPFVQADSSITRQYGGSGLGLAITRSLARMMDGDLSVISRKGAGTEFTLTFTVSVASDADLMDSIDAVLDANPEANAEPLIDTASEYDATADADLDEILGLFPATSSANGPVSTPPEATQDIAIDTPAAVITHETMTDNTGPVPSTAAEAQMDSLQNVRVMIVEDVPSNTDVMKIFLEPQGCLVMSAENGQVALDALKTQEFDVILMDIRMPEMDGIEATKIIRARGGLNAHVPIIALTADATAETNAQCMAAGADIFLTKPVIATELYDAIRFVRRQALRRAVRTGRVKSSASPIMIEPDRRSA